MQKKQCPECKSEKIMPIKYGYIDNPEALKQIENGEFATGGCLISEDSPKWECGECKNQFGKIDLNF
tara:strand:- start:273 stop:473 length:201 start_codon:yes stop_codon:yes gene_type:complete